MKGFVRSFTVMKKPLLCIALALAAPALACPVRALFSFTTPMSAYSPTILRRHYEQAAASKEAGEKFYDLLHNYRDQDALVLGYKAASEAIKARYVQQAARTFDQAVALAPDNAEIRFLRFSVESNLPPFLGLSKHVEEDKSFLLGAALRHPNSGLDDEAFRTVRGFLVGRGHVSEADAQRLAQVKGS